MRLIGSALLILLGLGLIYAGIGLNGWLEEAGIDVNDLFKQVETDPLAGWGAAGAGALSLLFGVLLFMGRYREEDDAWEDYQISDEMEEGRELEEISASRNGSSDRS